MNRSLRNISGCGEEHYTNQAEKLAGRLVAELNYSALEDIKTVGMHKYMDELQVKLNAIGEAIYQTYLFFPPIATGAGTRARGRAKPVANADRDALRPVVRWPGQLVVRVPNAHRKRAKPKVSRGGAEIAEGNSLVPRFHLGNALVPRNSVARLFGNGDSKAGDRQWSWLSNPVPKGSWGTRNLLRMAKPSQLQQPGVESAIPPVFEMIGPIPTESQPSGLIKPAAAILSGSMSWWEVTGGVARSSLNPRLL